ARVTERAVFFFQAEDGIRDRNVTGVQTCALPISHAPRPIRRRTSQGQPRCQLRERGSPSPDQAALRRDPGRSGRGQALQRWLPEIGRASCRERVWMWVEGVGWQRKRGDTRRGGGA